MDSLFGFATHIQCWAFLTLKNVASFQVAIFAIFPTRNAKHAENRFVVVPQWNGNDGEWISM